MTKPMQSNSELAQIVAQHNTLVNARFHMEEIETRLFLSGLRRIKKTDNEFSVCEIHKSEILPDASGGKSYELIKNAVFRLADRIIKIENTKEKTKRKFVATPLIAMCEYEEGTGLIKLLFNNSVKPYLLELKGNFTSTEIKYLFKIKKYSSNRLYWIIKSNFYGSNVSFEKDIDEIKEMLGIEGKYPNYFDFDKRVLKPAWEEIQNTDIRYEYNPVKVGKAVKKIQFIKTETFIPELTPGPVITGIMLPVDLEQQLRDVGITSIDLIARMVYENKINEGYIRFCLNYKRQKTSNLAGAIFSDIKEKYKWAAYEKANKAKKVVKVPQSSEPEKVKVKIELEDAKKTYESLIQKGYTKHSTWSEMLQFGYIEKGFKIVKEEEKEFLVKE